MSERPIGIQLFSDRCLQDGCPTPKILAENTCTALAQIGMGRRLTAPYAYGFKGTRCPGVAMGTIPVAGLPNRSCSFPGEMLEHIATPRPNIPSSIIESVVAGVLNGHISPAELPTPALPSDEDAAGARNEVEAWGSLLRTIEQIYYPGGQDPTDPTVVITPTSVEGQQQ